MYDPWTGPKAGNAGGGECARWRGIKGENGTTVIA